MCPELLPKKYVGRFTTTNDTISKDKMIYGERREVKGFDGLEFLKEGADVASKRLLTDEDLKKIRIAKLRQAAQKVDKKGFRSGSDSDSIDMSSMSEGAMEEGELEMEEGELEMIEGESSEEVEMPKKGKKPIKEEKS